MKRVDELLPWKVTDISYRPFKGRFGTNPSIHYDGQTWRCILRCIDYALPDGREIRSRKAKPGQALTKNAMLILESSGWTPTAIYKIREHDDHPRAAASSVGYEDIRLFRTDVSGLQGIAAALHLRRSDREKQRAEQVLISFDDSYNVTAAKPIRGPWSTSAQKNWSPFDNSAEPRFMYSITQGFLFGPSGTLPESSVRASTRPRPSPPPAESAARRARERADEIEDPDPRNPRDVKGDRHSTVSGKEDLRGGTQLVRIGDDAWLGIGHAMTFVDRIKRYWHRWYVVDSRGRMKMVSTPMKLSPYTIEFAAGLAIVGDRVVVSYGVDDMEAKIGETSFAAVRRMLGIV